MILKHYFHRALSLPPHVIAIKAYQMILFRLKSLFLQGIDTILTTYTSNMSNEKLHSLFPHAPAIENIKNNFSELTTLLDKVMNHEFNLLASGWTKVNYKARCKGINSVKYEMPIESPPTVNQTDWISKFINLSNQKKSMIIWQYVSKDYIPINWHIDFKSGYQWNAKTWWFRVPYGHKPGVDIKVPWELARGQHLPWLAFGFALENTSGSSERALKYATEFQDQLLDFIATNPPRYGVNWRCPMDVAIRASNWILTYDFLRHYGWEPRKEIKDILANSLHDHGDFIYKNLEIGKDNFRGNHYLADICGLAYIASFLPSTDLHNEWLQFSHRALTTEMDFQFFDDGANFEGSTAYHLLSAEMILYTTLVFENLDNEKRLLLPAILFDKKYYQKLFNMRQFSEAITLPDGNICQIGDNDSGRFFKIKPDFNGGIEENHISHASLIENLNAFFKKTSSHLSSQWILSMAKENEINNTETPLSFLNKMATISPLITSEVNHYLSKLISSNQFNEFESSLSTSIHTFPTKEVSTPSLYCYEKFGLHIWKGPQFFVSFRCGPVGQMGRGGHDHNDQLSVIIKTPEIDINDPGTGLYTPFLAIRNKYRSTKAHFTPQVIKEDGSIMEPGELNQGPFSLNSNQESELLFASDKILIGFNKKMQTTRIIYRDIKNIIVYDICLKKNWKLGNNLPAHIPFSKGYGFFN